MVLCDLCDLCDGCDAFVLSVVAHISYSTPGLEALLHERSPLDLPVARSTRADLAKVLIRKDGSPA